MTAIKVCLTISKDNKKVDEFYKELLKEIDKYCIDTNFKNQLIQFNIKRFQVKGAKTTTFEFLKELHKCMSFTIDRAIKGFIMDRPIDISQQVNGPQFIERLRDLDWSFVLKTMRGEPIEILNDYENMTINMINSKIRDGLMTETFVHLEDFVIDLEN